MTTTQVRPADEGDFAAIGALTVDVYVGGGFSRPDSPYLPELRDVAGRAAVSDVLVAVTEPGQGAAAAVVGAVTFCIGGTPYAELARTPDEAEFRMLVVAAAARGHGVGSALVTDCVGRARAAGCRTLWLSTQWNMAAAHRLYARLGFRRTPDRDWEPRPGVTLLTYSMDLSPAAEARTRRRGCWPSRTTAD